MRRLFISLLVLASFVLAGGTGSVLAQSGKWKSKPKISGDAAVLETLLEDQDSLNMVSAGHTRQIGELKERVGELEERLKQAEAEAAAAKKDAEAARTGVETLDQEVAEVRDRFVDGERKLPKFIPHFEFRVRPEYTTNRIDLNSDNEDKDFYYLQRIRLGATLEPQKGIRGTIVLQDSRTWGEILGTGMPQDSMELYEGYILLTDLFTPGFEVQVGRFAMGFGRERQIGKLDWGNRGRSFDGIRVAYHRPKVINMDLFATVIQDSRAAAGPNEDFYGLYLSTDVLDFMDFELYGLYLHNDTEGEGSRIGTVGARVEARPVKGLLLEAEAAVQFGKVDNDLPTGVASIDHLATAYGFLAQYAIPVDTTPTVGLFFHSASGDANPADDRNVAYRPLFPTGHRFYGGMDLFAWQGVWEIGPSFSLKLIEEVNVKAEYHAFFLSTDGGRVQDAFGGTTTFPSGSGKFVGHEIDLLVSWAAMKWLSLETGYSLFVPGNVAEKAMVTVDNGAILAMGNDTAHWFYLQVKASF